MIAPDSYFFFSLVHLSNVICEVFISICFVVLQQKRYSEDSKTIITTKLVCIIYIVSKLHREYFSTSDY